jgi:hypothetical protein
MLTGLIKIEVGCDVPMVSTPWELEVSKAHLCNFRIEEGSQSMRLLVRLRCYQGDEDSASFLLIAREQLGVVNRSLICA